MSNFIDDEIADILDATEHLLTSDQILVIKKSLVNAIFAGAMDSEVLKDAEKSAIELGIIDE